MVQRRLAWKFGGSFKSKSVVIWTALAWIVVLHTYQSISRGKRAVEASLDTGVFEIGGSLSQADFERSRKPKKKNVFNLQLRLPGDAILQGSGGYLFPGRPWLDTDGKPIQAHGGCMLYVNSTKTFYWYGENKNGRTYTASSLSRVDLIGINCYQSKDLLHWTNLGLVLKGDSRNKSSDLYKKKVLERPKVIYNDKTEKYVMWMHVDNSSYDLASVGVAISDRPEGPFKYLGKMRPHGYDSRDLTLFKDEDGNAYLIYSSETNSALHIGRLSSDYLNVTGSMVRRMVDQSREAPAVFKHNNLYYMVTSGCTGWAPNAAMVHVASHMMSSWHTLGDPCVGGDEEYRQKTFMSQGTFIFQLPSLKDKFVFMADKWKEEDLGASTYVWLPLAVEGKRIAVKKEAESELEEDEESDGVWPSVRIRWKSQWRLPSAFLSNLEKEESNSN